MAVERLILEVTSTGTKRVVDELTRLGRAATQAAEGTDRLEDELGELTSAGRQANQQLRRTERTVQRTQRSFVNLRSVIGTLGIGLAARQFARLSDSGTELRNRLRVVTDSAEELAAVQARLFDISEDTRSSVEANAGLFSRLSLSTSELGTTTEELLQFTESLNQAIRISGATAQEANAGLIQLSQGLASGALRGDELRSVLEQLPVVADVISRELGVTRGELRRLGQEGRITAEVVLNAFANAREELDERFGRTIPTIAENTTVLKNSFIELTDALEESLGIGRTLSQIIGSLSTGISQLAEDIKSSGLAVALFNQVATDLEAKIDEIVEKNTGKGIPDTFDRTKLAADEAVKSVKSFDQAVADLAERGVPIFGSRSLGSDRNVPEVGDPLGRLSEGDGPSVESLDRLVEIDRTFDSIAQTSFEGVVAGLGDMQRAIVEVDNTWQDFGRGFGSVLAELDVSLKGFGADIANILVGGINEASVALADFAVDGFRNTEDLKAAFSDLFRTLARDILAATIRLIILRSLFGSQGFGGGPGGSTGGLVGLIGGAIGGNQIGGFGGGGDLSVVGERGPELIQFPAGGGRVTRTEDIGARMRPVVNVRVVNVTSADDPEAQRGVEDEEFVLNTIQKNPETVRGILN